MLIGRDRELADLLERVRSGRRLVTITGPGGIGKTTVARAVAAALEPRGSFVALADVEQDAAVAGYIAAALGFASFDVLVGGAEVIDRVLILDNCEHVADGAAAAARALAESCPDLTVIATSRSPLAVDGESLVVLAPLPVPPPGAADAASPSVRLFRERAHYVGVSIGDTELELAGELCRRVDGMPLALELAAARLRTLSLGDLVTRLDDADVLSRQRHRGSARHRSVRDTINWSIDLLAEPDRDHLAQFAVGAGLFELRSVARIVELPEQEAIGFLERMVDASLVQVERGHDVTRYRLLEPIRQVAVERLGPEAEFAARERLSTAVFEWVSEMLVRSGERWWASLLHDLMAGFDQFAAAVRHCLAHDADPLRVHTFCMVLWGAVHQGRVDDVLVLTEAVLKRWPADRGSGADAMATYAIATLLHGDINRAEELAERYLPYAADSWAAGIGLRRDAKGVTAVRSAR